MGAGRKRVPKPIKLALGNPGKRAIADEPSAPASTLQIPASLVDDQVAIEEYLSLGKQLLAWGLMDSASERLVVLYAETYSAYRRNRDELKKEGEMLRSSNGNLIPNQRTWLVERLKKELVKMLGELGMTPTTRAKLTGPVPLASGGVPSRGYAEQVLRGFNAASDGRMEDTWQPPGLKVETA